MSLNSHSRPLSMNDLKTHGAKFSWSWGSGDFPTPLANGDTCAVVRNASQREEVGVIPSVEIDTQCMPTPLVLRKQISTDVFGT